MAPGKNQKKPKESKQYGFKVPLAYETAWQTMLEKEDRGITRIVLRALALYAHQFGHEWPESPPTQEQS